MWADCAYIVIGVPTVGRYRQLLTWTLLQLKLMTDCILGPSISCGVGKGL